MKRTIAFLFSALMLAACKPEPIHPVNVVEAPDFISVIVEGDHNHFWNEADEILVEGSGSAIYKVITGGAESDLEKVSGDAGNGPFTAYYPANAKEHLIIPAEKDYSSEMPANLPLVAISNNRILPFRSILGTLVITLISEEETVVIKVNVSANQPLSGEYQVVDGKALLSGDGGVTVNCPDGLPVNISGAHIYLELPEGRYDGVKMSIVDNMGRERVLDLGAMPFTVEGNGIVGYPVDLGAIHQNRAVLLSGPEFNKAVKSYANGTAIESVSYQDKKVRNIIFEVNSAVDTGCMLQGRDSDYPIYGNYDKVTGAFTISTAASEFYTVKDASSMFRCFTRAATVTNLKALNTENTENMSAMFAEDGVTAMSMDGLDFSNFNTSRVTRMDSMFFNMLQLTTLDLSAMDTRNCTTFGHFLETAKKLKTFNAGAAFTACSAKDLSCMFKDCIALESLDLSTFDTSGAEDMSCMFQNVTKVKTMDLSGFNTSRVTTMSNMFHNCNKLTALDLRNFDTTRVEEMDSMFFNCNALQTLDVTSFATSNVFDMNSMFRNCYVLEELDLSSFNLTIVNPGADYMFCQLRALKTLKLGDSFILINGPQYFACSSMDARSTRTSSVPGKLTIVCNQTIADWISITTFRWLNSGYSGAGAIPITFQDEDTGKILKVTWANN